MRILICVLTILTAFSVNAERLQGEEAVQFCRAWTQDAIQAAEKMEQGLDGERIENLIDNIPDEMLHPDRKEMAKSAVRWTYYFNLTGEEAEQMGMARCMGCVDQVNQQACVAKFDKGLEQYKTSDSVAEKEYTF